MKQPPRVYKQSCRAVALKKIQNCLDGMRGFGIVCRININCRNHFLRMPSQLIKITEPRCGKSLYSQKFVF